MSILICRLNQMMSVRVFSLFKMGNLNKKYRWVHRTYISYVIRFEHPVSNSWWFTVVDAVASSARWLYKGVIISLHHDLILSSHDNHNVPILIRCISFLLLLINRNWSTPMLDLIPSAIKINPVRFILHTI